MEAMTKTTVANAGATVTTQSRRGATAMTRDDEAEQKRQQMRPVTMPDIPPFRIRRNEALFRNLIGEQRHRHAEHRIAQRLHAPHLEKPGPACHRCSPQRHSGMRRRRRALWSRNDKAVLTLTSYPPPGLAEGER